MHRSGLNSRLARLAAISFLVASPFIMGEGCPGPITGRTTGDALQSAQDTPASDTGNTPPSFSFTSPTSDVALELGDVTQLSWTVSDPDSNASIEILLDPDGDFGNGNERVIVPLILEDSGVTSFNLDTGAFNLQPVSYRVIARVNDGINPELLVVATGHLLLFSPGLLPGNKAPSVITTLPNQSIGASQGDQVAIAYCAKDTDNGPNGTVPDVVVLLDLDNDPNNDLDLNSASAQANLSQACSGGLPKAITGAIVVACAKDDDCASVANATQLNLPIDVGLIPPTATGNPYRVRTTIWDHLNKPVSSYAPGSINITALGSGMIDLAQVGKTVSGARFQGFDSGARAGSTGVDMGDFDGDGADDFIIVERFGVPGGAALSGSSTTGSGTVATPSSGNIGTAHMVFGRPGQRFGGDISLNSVSVTVRGTYMSMNGGFGPPGGCSYGGPATVAGLTGTNGIVSVARVADTTGDNKPELLIGLPYVEQFFDYIDDDICDCPCPTGDPLQFQGCYIDGFPNPLSTNTSCEPKLCGQTDQMGSSDSMFGREFFGPLGNCSNDQDPTQTQSINGGYALIVSSENEWDNSSISLNLTGQRLPPSNEQQFFGTRFRGPWWDTFDLTKTKHPYSIIPDNLFGQTVNSMPGMIDTRQDISPRFGEALLISSPQGEGGKGSVFFIDNGDLTNFTGTGNSNSLPDYPKASCTCGSGALFDRSGDLTYPGSAEIIGATIGDHFGYAAAAGDYNLDGSRDILAGAPQASRVPPGLNRLVSHGGIVYVFFGRRDFGGFDLSSTNVPRMEIQGTNDEDQFGSMQTIVGDINQDGVPDFGFSSALADGPGGTDAGFIGIVFGGRQLTGENIFTVGQVGTAQLPGCKIYGAQPGGHAGTIISNVGDFNGDGIDDLLICAPDETIVINGQTRRGKAYLIFGGPHLVNASLSLSQIGTPQLPGVVFVTPYVLGSADEAPIDSVAAAGDVNGDGFADVLIGVSTADFVNPLEPSQRRTDSGEMFIIYGSNTGSNALR